MTTAKVRYYTPIFMRDDGWYFIIPACDAPPEIEGDTIAGMFPCKEMAQAAIRLCTQTVTHCNDNVFTPRLT